MFNNTKNSCNKEGLYVAKHKARSFYIIAVLVVFNIMVMLNSACAADGGSIKGNLIDEMNLPIANATLLLKTTADSTVYKTTISDDKGYFHFDLLKNGEYTLEVSKIGLQTSRKSNIIISAASQVISIGSIQIKTENQMLKEVVVKSKVPLIDRQVDKTVVNLENSILSVGSNSLEVLDKLPGVRVTNDEQVTLNGKNVTVYIDGRETHLSGEALSGLLKGMSSGNIQKIELIPQTSAKYDAATSGGVINIVKKKNRNEGVSGNINFNYALGRFERYGTGVNLNYRNKYVNVFFNMDYMNNQYAVKSLYKSEFLANDQNASGFLTSKDEGKRHETGYSPSLGVDFYLSKKTTLTASSNMVFQKFNRNVTSDISQLDIDHSSAYTSVNNTVNQPDNYSGNLHLLHNVDTTGQQITVDLDYLKYTTDLNQRINNFSNNSIGNQNAFLSQNNNLAIYSAKADYTKPFKGNLTLEAGLKTSYVKSKNLNQYAESDNKENLQQDQFNYSENIYGMYVNINKKAEKFTTQLGLRAEYTHGVGEQLLSGTTNKREYLQFFPSAFFDYKIDDNHGLNLKLNRRIRRPNYANLNPALRIINSTTSIKGNPDLQPVISYNSLLTYSLGEKFSFLFGWSINLHDVTPWVYPGANEQTTTITLLNNTYTQYFNFATTYSDKLTDWWSIDNTLNFYKQPYKGVFNGITVYDKSLFSFDIESNHSFKLNDRLSMECSFLYESKYQNINKITDPRYRINLGVKQLLFGDRASVAISVNDIFDSYRDNYSYNSLNLLQSSNNNNDTRFVRATLSYRFGNYKNKKSGSGRVEEQGRTGELKPQ